ncbi:hypothetical protein AKJ16_DCAP14788 [Drosera capensis]
MAAISKTLPFEFESPVAPARLLKAPQHHDLFPKLMPESFESIEVVEGDSVKVGSVQQFNFPKGHYYKYVCQAWS